MKRFKICIISCFIFFSFLVELYGQQLMGTIGSSSESFCGWLVLERITNFHEGDTLTIRLGGTARKILVRMLNRNNSPTSPSGIIGDVQTVSEKRIVKIILDSDYEQIQQISVHGGPNPWGLYFLGQENGLATIRSIRLNKVRK